VQNRYHQDINGFFICDRGRFGHDFANSERRLKDALVKTNASNKLEAKEALAHMRGLLSRSKNIIGIGSSSASLEANWLLKKLVGKDNFYDGLPHYQSAPMQTLTSLLKQQSCSIASLKEVRNADCVVIFGEDLTNTAPMMALSIRQAALSFKQKESEGELGISPWNDAAVKDFARGYLLPVFSLHAHGISLDTLHHQNAMVHPNQLTQVAFGLLRALSNENYRASLSAQNDAWVTSAKDALQQAKHPVIIAGTSLANPELIRLAHDITYILNQTNENARLALVVPEVNSLGLAMLDPKPLGDFLNKSSSPTIDSAIILENDLHWRLGSKAFSVLCQRVKNLAVLDNLETETSKAASIVLPCLSFLESTGTMISSEGRLQQYFGAASPNASLTSSAHVLSALSSPEGQEDLPQDLGHNLAKDLGVDPSCFEHLYRRDFRVLSQKIPRQTSGASGRTAINAGINIHEQKPPRDKDSPLSFSMEGIRKKIPLPLISSPWAPQWNSVQASFKSILAPESQKPDAFGGVRLFSKQGTSYKPVAALSEEHAAVIAPKVLVLPKHHIFGSFQKARFSSSLATRMPNVEAEISINDAKKLGISSFAYIVLETSQGKFSLLAKSKEDVPEGVLVLPFGLVDASVFFSESTCHVVDKEQV
jgi:NADH-quinone oxidoreductase subunit G